MLECSFSESNKPGGITVTGLYYSDNTSKDSETGVLLEGRAHALNCTALDCLCCASASLSGARARAAGIDDSGGPPGWRIDNVAAWSREDLKLKSLRLHLDDMGLQYFYPAVPLRKVVEQFDRGTLYSILVQYSACLLYSASGHSCICRYAEEFRLSELWNIL